MGAADFPGGVAIVNLTPVQVAAILGLLIALFVGALVIVQSLQSATWQVQLVPHAPESADASMDASIPSGGLTPSAQSGTARLFAGFTNVPHGAFVYTFLQADGLEFAAPWSSVRGGESHITMPSPLTNWTNPGPCGTGVQECGHLAVAVPVSTPPGRPEAWILNAGVEMPIDGANWARQHGELTLNGRQYFVILTDAADIPAGATVTLRWLPWDGTGAAALPAP